MPFFSVIIPTYNRAQFIIHAINSVISQTFDDFELIIIDDASTDNTEELIQAVNDARIIYVKNITNQERCASRNLGIHKSCGQYICFLDSDDFYLENHLQVLYNAINEKNNAKAYFFTNAYNLKDGLITDRFCSDIIENNKYHFFMTYTVNPPRMCIHREIMNEIKFDPNINICEDMDLSLRIAAKFPIFQINERTVIYNLHLGTFTLGDSQKPFKELDSFRKIFLKTELKGLLPVKSKKSLLSMAFFHASIYYESKKNFYKMYDTAFRSFLLCPRGYNGKTNKILLVMVLYHIPILGKLLKFFKRII